MKKSFIILSIAVLFVLVLNSCTHDEVYNPKCKISKIWFRSDVGDADQIFNYEKNELVSITLQDGLYYYFEYNKDHTVNKITHLNKFNFEEAVQLTYVDKSLTKIEYTMDGALREEVDFVRDVNDNISTITCNYDREFFNSLDKILQSDFYRTFIGDSPELLKTLAKQEMKSLVLYSISIVTYDEKNHNITNVATTIPDYNTVSVTDYTYDEGFNPYFGLSYVYANLNGYSKNNKVLERCVTKVSGYISTDVTTTYEYQYNDLQYPRRIVTRASDNNNIPVNTYILFVKE
jgi:hypothetical protein